MQKKKKRAPNFSAHAASKQCLMWERGPLSSQAKVGVVCAKGLGDALIYMVLSHNLKCSGVPVTTFSSALGELASWFPGHAILPTPHPSDFEKTFSGFDYLFVADHAAIREPHSLSCKTYILKEHHFDKKHSLVENLAFYCKNSLHLPFHEKHNGIVAPNTLTFRAHSNRVLIHPTSTEKKRTWPASRFLALSKRLQSKGFIPFFCMNLEERIHWESLVSSEYLPRFTSLSELAGFIYESGFLIGNNSGLGHLASCLNIPTLSLFARMSYAHLWRPGWGIGRVVTPFPFLIGAGLKQRYWKELLTPKRVMRHFAKLSMDWEGNASASPPYAHSSEKE